MNLYIKIIICVLLCVTLGLLSGLSTVNEIDGWFATVQKPSWNPPNWLFSPVWTTLYILMGIAAGIIWHSNDDRKVMGLMLFILQFMLNMAWSYIFFEKHAIGWALAEIVLLLTLIIITTISFYRIKPLAGYLMIPYILWVSFATFLNGAIWMLNK